MPSILVIDDKKAALDELVSALGASLGEGEARIVTWVPTNGENALTEFEKKLAPDTVLVVADEELTSQGLTGLFGSSIVDWCQARAKPVADYSRLRKTALPKPPGFLEITVPSDPALAAPIIAVLFRGFKTLGDKVASSDEYLRMRSPAAVLANALERPEVENQFALYAVRLAASGALMEILAEDKDPSPSDKRSLLSYIAGHLLLSVLRFPGPILSLGALKAYVASDEADAKDVLELFKEARYTGPFAGLDQYLWRVEVDSVLDTIIPTDLEVETPGELRRIGIEKRLGRKLRRHGCPHCEGKNGGFLCPFTRRTVCHLAYCSVSSNSWMPQGALLCRIEKEFFDEWSPVLGL